MIKLVGIDYSISSPGLCYYSTDALYDTFPSINKCRFMSLTEDATLKNNKNFKEYQNFDWYVSMGHNFFVDRWMLKASICMDWLFRNVQLNGNDKLYVALEGYAFAAKGQVFNIAEATHELKRSLYINDFPYIIYQPRELKKWYTGNGRAKKTEICECIEKRNLLTLDSLWNIPFDHSKSPADDLADSYVAMCMLYDQLKSEKISDDDFVRSL